MRSPFLHSVMLLGLSALLFGAGQAVWPQSAQQQGGDFSQNPQGRKLPTGTILVKGAWSSASDSVTPVPERGHVIGSVYRSSYFRLAYPLPPGWTQKYLGPPPSDSGYYVLALLQPADFPKGRIRGSILITAQDLFFTLTPATNALEQIDFAKAHLQADYKVERPPSLVNIANHFFTRFDYFSPVAGLHWYVLATQIRCHVVEFVFTSRDTALMQSLLQGMSELKLPAEASPILGTGGDDVPVCVKDYARDENVIEKVEPVFTDRRLNPIPVRIIINRQGQVKFIHFLSAFPDQAKAITDALYQWRFKPYLLGGQPVDVETGIIFGNAPRSRTGPASQAVN